MNLSLGLDVDLKEINSIIDLCFLLAFEAGKWSGQVDLEEHMDREQFSQVALESILSRSTSMPAKDSSSGKTVEYNLRSDKWREGVRNSSIEKMEIAKGILTKKLMEVL